MIKINGFAFINGQEQKMLTYTLSETDETGRIIKSNIRKSMAVLDTDTLILDAKTVIENRIIELETK